MSYFAITTNGLLSVYNREHEPLFTWTYSVFEKICEDSITPSMYEYMKEYTMRNIPPEVLDNFSMYRAGDIEENAISAYYEEPIIKRISMHQKTLRSLKKSIEFYKIRETDALRSLYVETQWNSLTRDYNEFLRDIANTSREIIDNLDRKLHEEEGWYGGHEENYAHSYDPNDEV